MSDFELYIFLAPIFTVFGFSLIAYLLWTLLHRYRSPTSTFAWILAIVLLPYVGIPLYILLGGRKLRRVTRNKGMLRDQRDPEADTKLFPDLLLPSTMHGVFPTTCSDEVKLITDSGQVFHEILSLIEEAKHRIDVCTYLFGSDSTGRSIIRALANKAEQGVRVRVLIDSYGSMTLPARFLDPITLAGGHVLFFMPILKIPFQRGMNLRNHRKMLLIDEEIAVIGGMNLSADYMGDDPEARYWGKSVV